MVKLKIIFVILSLILISLSLVSALPDYFDWRDKDGENWMTSIKQQGNCGSCWAFSTLGAFEAHYNIRQDDPDHNLNLSEEYLVADCYDAGSCCGISGTTLAPVLNYIENDGVVNESCLEYADTWSCTCNGGTCDANCNYRTSKFSNCSDFICSDNTCTAEGDKYKIIDYESISSNKTAIKNYLYGKGPLAVVMYWDGVEDFNADIFTCDPDSGSGYHAVIITGYNETGDYWIVKNSHGSTWGPYDNGYFYVGFEECSIEDYIYGIDLCECASWQLAGGCGDSGCDGTDKPYTRICTPSGCASESKCEYVASCDASGATDCDTDYCSGNYEQVGDPSCEYEGNYWTCERTCLWEAHCGSYGAYTYQSYSSEWDGLYDRGDWFYSPTIYFNDNSCWKYYGKSYFSVSGWGTADSYTLTSSTDSGGSDSSCKTSSASEYSDIITFGRGDDTYRRTKGKGWDYGAGDCTGGTPINDLEGTLYVYNYYSSASWISDDYDNQLCDVPYTKTITIDSTIYGNSDADCYVEVRGDESYPDKIKVKWYVNGDRVDYEYCDDGGSYDECDDDSGSTWSHTFTLDSSEFSKGDEVYCIARGYGEDDGHGAYVSSSTTTVSNRVPTWSSISLNESLVKPEAKVKVTANSEADLDGDVLAMYCCNGPSCTPTTSNHDFCYVTGDSSPYYLSCVGQAPNTNGTQTVRCRIYDGDSYSSSVKSDTYDVDNSTAPPNDTHKFQHKNSSGDAVAWFGSEGNIVLTGNCFSGGNCNSPGPDSFIIRNSTHNNVAYVNSTGDLCISSGDCSDQSANCNSPSGDSFIVQNNSVNMLYLDETGDLCLTGELYENSNP